MNLAHQYEAQVASEVRGSDMADITMCCNTLCPLNSKCYRFMAVANEYCQSYQLFEPLGEKECSFFWPIEKGDIIRDK